MNRSTTATAPRPLPVSIQILALLRQSALGERIRQALDPLEGVAIEVRLRAEGQPLPWLASDPSPDILLVEIDGRESLPHDAVERFLQKHREFSRVFLLHADLAKDVLNQWLRAGVDHAYGLPLQMQAIVLDVVEFMSEKRNRQQHAQTRPGSLTSFMSGCGGAGATTLATNIASVLVARHARKVALVDLDLHFGAVALSLDLRANATVLQALSRPERIDSLLLQALMTRHASGLQVLASPGAVMLADPIDSGATTHLLQALMSLYPMVVVDVPRLLEPWTVEALLLSNPVMLVTQNSLLQVRDTKLLLDHLPTLGVPRERIEIISNRMPTKARGLDLDEMCQVLGVDAVHAVNSDPEAVNVAQGRGVPVWQIQKRSAMAQDVERLADHLTTLHGEVVEAAPGFLRRWLKGG